MTNGRVIDYAQVDWEANAPRSIFFDDIYFSGGGADETEHVFIKGNDLERRLAVCDRFTIGELGFGSGLNFFSVCALWRKARRPGASLHFLSFEKYPLRPADLRRAGGAWPHFNADIDALARAFPPPLSGFHQLRFADSIMLTLALGDAAERLALCEAQVDAWFLDGFSPAKNPEMWSEAVIREIARLSAPGATAATYTVAGEVRRRLEAAGFAVEKRTGYGRKREMLTARIDRPDQTSNRAPWFPSARRQPLSPGDRVAIIGGGVAGACLADAAAAAGLMPVIIDPIGLAGGASGNPAGLIMPRLDLGDAPASRFFGAAYVHALRTIARLEAEIGRRLFNPCGVLARSLTAEDVQWAEKLSGAGLLPPDHIDARGGDVFFPQAGVIDPPAFVRALASAADRIEARAICLRSSEGGVRIQLDNGETVAAAAAVIANGADALGFAESRTLPLSRVAGQIDWFPGAATPPHALAFGRYAAPAPAGGLVIGATYEQLAGGESPRTSLASTRSTIDAVAAALPDLAPVLRPEDAVSRASVRCQTPDRLPIAGPAPDVHFYGAHYDDLRLGKSRDYPQGRRVPRVHLLTGLGSRGLVTAPLCAAMIVAEMTCAPAPAGRDIAEALHPARFFIRDLKRAVRRRPK
jgi:tRNA 5-methylaminomethyl-2-thiouridine biosynthesis bifunctional protein